MIKSAPSLQLANAEPSAIHSISLPLQNSESNMDLDSGPNNLTDNYPNITTITSHNAIQLAQNNQIIPHSPSTQETPEWKAARDQILNNMVTSQDLAQDIVQGVDPVLDPSMPPPVIIARGGIKTGGRRGRGGGRRPKIKIEPAADDTISTLETAARGGRGKSVNRGGRPRGSRAGATSSRGINRGGRPRGGSRAGAVSATSGRGVKRKRKSGKGDTDDEQDDTDASEVIAQPQLSSSGRRITQATTFSPVVIDLEAAPSRSAKTASNVGLGADIAGTGSARKGKRKRLAGSTAVCTNCGRGHSPTGNMIVFCDGCNNAWHQYCHDRPITPSVILIEEKEWHCGECETQREESGHLAGKISATENMGLVEKRQYFQSLEKKELVSLLLHASTMHSDLPVFDQHPRTPAAPMPNNESLGRNVIMAPPPGEDEENYEIFVDLDELPYPKPGNGLKLPPELDDFDILIDEDVVSYSHSWLHSGGWTGAMRESMGIGFAGGGVRIGVGA